MVLGKSATASAEPDDRPVRFTTSGGHNMRPTYRVPKQPYKPFRFEGLFVIMSFYSVLIYFCLLREANDIDNAIGNGTLFSPEVSHPVFKNLRSRIGMNSRALGLDFPKPNLFNLQSQASQPIKKSTPTQITYRSWPSQRSS